MSEFEYTNLVNYLTATAIETFDQEPGYPATFAGFMDVMWQDDSNMKHWEASRTEYRSAMKDAYMRLTERA